MIIVKLKGGLGNQMFQYAFGKSLALKNETALELDLSYLKDRKPKRYFKFRDFELDIFNIDSKIADDDYGQIQKLKIITEPHFHFFPDALNYTDNNYLDGYWQSEKYFKANEETIRNEFTFRNPLPDSAINFTEKILNANSVCLHVRHGFTDNIKDRLYHGFVGLNYIKKAIDLIRCKISNPEIFVFSDNPNWCMKNIKVDIPIHFVENEICLENKDYFQMMTMCKHFIISNSSFSWWGAWLANNPDKIVISPKKWFRFSLDNTKDLLPDKWIKI